MIKNAIRACRRMRPQFYSFSHRRRRDAISPQVRQMRSRIPPVGFSCCWLRWKVRALRMQ